MELMTVFFFKSYHIVNKGLCLSDHRENKKLPEKHWEGSITWYQRVIDTEREEEAVILGIQHNLIVSWICGGKIPWWLHAY